jgi:hypothetical protein
MDRATVDNRNELATMEFSVGGEAVRIKAVVGANPQAWRGSPRVSLAVSRGQPQARRSGGSCSEGRTGAKAPFGSIFGVVTPI